MYPTSELEYIKYTKEIPIKFLIHSVENSSLHWHYEYELFFVLKGTVTVNTKNEEFILKEGDMILFNSRDVHSTSSSDKNICLFLQFNPELLSTEIKHLIFHFELNTALNMPPNKKVIKEYQTILAKMGLLFHEKPDGYRFFIKSQLYALIGSLFQNLPYKISQPIDNIVRSEELKDFDLIKQYIQEHFKEDINQEKLCKDLGMSRSKVFRLLKSTGSTSTNALINYYRIEYAKNLLRNTKNSISYIAVNCGFQSDSSFHRVFKDTTGVSPTQYREDPSPKKVRMGIQRYADYSSSDAMLLLKKFSQ